MLRTSLYLTRQQVRSSVRRKRIPSSLSNCMRPTSASQPQHLSRALIGAWELVGRVDRTRRGERRVDPGLGEDPIALLYYDTSGHFAAQFMKRNRSLNESVALSGAVPTSGESAPNNSRAQGGYDAYFGTYTVDDARGTVTQRLVGALSAENVGQVLTRSVTVEEYRLTIEVETAASDGEPLTRTLVWRRARPTE
jgi:Lipocalin-like domain